MRVMCKITTISAEHLLHPSQNVAVVVILAAVTPRQATRGTYEPRARRVEREVYPEPLAPKDRDVQVYLWTYMISINSRGC